MEILSTQAMDKDQQILKVILSNIQVIQKIELLLAENDSLLAEKNTEGVAERISQCRNLLLTIQRAGKKEMTRKYNSLFQINLGDLLIPSRLYILSKHPLPNIKYL